MQMSKADRKIAKHKSSGNYIFKTTFKNLLTRSTIVVN